MRIFSGVSGIVILALVLSFIFSNQQETTVGLWPLKGSLGAPLYMVGLAPLGVGLVFGSFLSWVSGMKHRLRARQLNKELVALSDKIGDLQKKAVVQNAKVKPHLPFWRR